MKTHKTEGIIIKRRNLGEADRILTVFTKKFGKVQVKAPGVRKITSRRSSHTELINYGVFTLYEGRKNFVLTEADTLDNFLPVKKDLSKVTCVYHFCELVDGLCAENQENIEVFHLLKGAICDLAINSPEEIIEGFEIKLLNILGFYRANAFPKNFNRTAFIEQILERKLKSRQIQLG